MRRRLPPGVVVAEDATLGADCRFDLAEGAEVAIGAGAQVGDRCVFAVRSRVTIEAGARIGDEVAFVDHVPVVDDVERPVRAQGVRAAPIVVGSGAVIGPGAVLEAGAVVAGDEVVLPRSVVPGATRGC